MTLIQRLRAPTPKFFRVVRAIGLGLTAAGGAITASTVALPPVIVTIGHFLIAAGSVATAVSQTAVCDDKK